MIGNKLRQLRHEKNLTQKELAQILGIPRGTYAHYELNKRTPDYGLLIDAAQFYEVSTDYLLDLTDIRSSPNKIKEGYSIQKDIKKDIQNIIKKLESEQDLTFDGEPFSSEGIEWLIDVINFSIEQTKKRNK